MKSEKILIGAIALLGLMLGSCQKQEITPGEDTSKPAPQNIIYDIENATDSTFNIKFDVAECLQADAKSFTVQISSTTEASTNFENYSSTVTTTVYAEDIEGTTAYAEYTGRKEYNSYYVKVRANYEYSVFSSWAWASLNDEPCLVEVGHGMVDTQLATPSLSIADEKAETLQVTLDASSISSSNDVRFILIDFNSQSFLIDQIYAGGQTHSIELSGLTVGKLYQIKARQEQAGTEYDTLSEWQFAEGAAQDEDTGESVVSTTIQIGSGWVATSGVPPTARAKSIYSGMMVLEWSVNGFSDITEDTAADVTVCLYTDAACTNLHYGFDMATDVYIGEQPCMTFANLEPGTTYYFKVTNNENGLVSDVYEFTTEEFDIVRVGSTTVAEGEYAVAENCSEIYFGSNTVDIAPGLQNVTSLTTPYPTPGTMNSATVAADNFNHGFFNTMGNNGKVQNSRFNDWAVIHETISSGEVLGDLCVHTGSFQMGASSGMPQLYTPELTNLQSLATVELTLVVSTMAEKGVLKENTSSDFQTIAIYTATGGTRTETKSTSYGKLSDATVTQVATIERPTADKLGWETKTVTIDNVSPGMRIGFGAVRPDGKTGNQRFMLREVTVKVLSYGAPTLTKPVVQSVEKSDVDFTVTYDTQSSAQSYVISYKECGETEWTEYPTTTPVLHLEGLEPQTEFHVKAKAVAGEYESEESDVIVVETDAPEVVALATPVVTLTAGVDNIRVAWEAVESATSYNLYYRLSTDSDYTTVAEGLTELGYTITGLSSNTSYDVAVKAFYKTNESDYGTATVTTVNYEVPSTITTADEFVDFMNMGAAMTTTGQTVTIGNDLDLTGKTFYAASGLAGTLDGNGKTISNLTLDHPLFTEISGSVKNLTIDSSCSFTADDNTFAVLAQNVASGATIEYVTNKAAVTLSVSSADASICGGAIAGLSKGAITNCVNEGKVTVTSDSYVSGVALGGIVGYQAAALSGCTNRGEVELNATYVKARTAIGDKSNVPSNVGGICGMGWSGFTASSCNNYGEVDVNVTAVENMTAAINRNGYAGIVGQPHGDITDCHNYGVVNVTAVTSTRAAYGTLEFIICVGGISGCDYLSTSQNETNITNCTNNAAINADFDIYTSNSTVGGIVGWPGVEGAGQTVVISGCTNNADVTISGEGYGRFGGIAGGAGNVTGCTNNGKVTRVAPPTSTKTNASLGGVSGYSSYNFTFTNNANYGDVTNGDSVGMCGGLIGAWANQACNNGQGAGCTVKCNVTNSGTREKVGMIIGRFNGSSHTRTFGSTAVGGTITWNDGGSQTVTIDAENLSTYVAGTSTYNDTCTFTATLAE